MKNPVALAEESVYNSLRQAKIIGLVHMETMRRDDYKEWIYIVAWQRKDQCGTHRVCVNNNEETMCIIGHYDLNRDDAFKDLLNRSGLKHD